MLSFLIWLFPSNHLLYIWQVPAVSFPSILYLVLFVENINKFFEKTYFLDTVSDGTALQDWILLNWLHTLKQAVAEFKWHQKKRQHGTSQNRETDELPVMAYGALLLSEFSVNPQMNFLSRLIFHDRLLVPSMDEKQAKNITLILTVKIIAQTSPSPSHLPFLFLNPFILIRKKRLDISSIGLPAFEKNTPWYVLRGLCWHLDSNSRLAFSFLIEIIGLAVGSRCRL